MRAMRFAVWLTGLPASGKSAIARELVAKLHRLGVDAAHLESDVLRTQITPYGGYGDDERDAFYAALAELAIVLVKQGRCVVIDATANRRRYRDRGRDAIRRFAEVLVDTPAHVCAGRDPKGLYRAARHGNVLALPGVHAAYEPPLQPELVVRGCGQQAGDAADSILNWLAQQGWLEIMGLPFAPLNP
jgi:adenylylsulfate kinase